jgi:hypothetical protein
LCLGSKPKAQAQVAEWNAWTLSSHPAGNRHNERGPAEVPSAPDASQAQQQVPAQ